MGVTGIRSAISNPINDIAAVRRGCLILIRKSGLDVIAEYILDFFSVGEESPKQLVYPEGKKRGYGAVYSAVKSCRPVSEVCQDLFLVRYINGGGSTTTIRGIVGLITFPVLYVYEYLCALYCNLGHTHLILVDGGAGVWAVMHPGLESR